MNLQQHIDNAPDIKGARKLNATEPAQAGDRFLYLQTLPVLGLNPADLSFALLSEVKDGEYYIRIGCSLEQALASWAQDNSPTTFDGVIYRPLSS